MGKYGIGISTPVEGQKRLQDEIVKRWGVLMIAQARNRLCLVCKFAKQCANLLPLTLAGKDCPYYGKDYESLINGK